MYHSDLRGCILPESDVMSFVRLGHRNYLRAYLLIKSDNSSRNEVYYFIRFSG